MIYKHTLELAKPEYLNEFKLRRLPCDSDIQQFAWRDER